MCQKDRLIRDYPLTFQLVAINRNAIRKVNIGNWLLTFDGIDTACIYAEDKTNVIILRKEKLVTLNARERGYCLWARNLIRFREESIIALGL